MIIFMKHSNTWKGTITTLNNNKNKETIMKNNKGLGAPAHSWMYCTANPKIWIIPRCAKPQN
jgi:hypothetical protein